MISEQSKGKPGTFDSETLDDLKVIEERRDEPDLDFEDVLKDLKASGKL